MYTVTIRTLTENGWQEQPWTVHAIAPGAMREPSEPNRDLSIIAYTLYGPAAGAPTSAAAQVVLDGVTYSVDGTPKDWTRGPGPVGVGGVVVELTRAEG